MAYVDGFVLAVKKDRLDDYKRIAEIGKTVWLEKGALAYSECLADDVPYGEVTSFPRAVQAKDDEIVVFSWIVYASREERDRVNAAVRADPRIQFDPATSPFDMKTMIFGGFVPIVEGSR